MVSTRSMALATAMAVKPGPPAQAESVAAEDEAASGQDAEARQEQRDLSSSEKVFDIAELAEIILCLLPLDEILSMRRVCRACTDVIHTSKAVQKGLCVYTARELGAGPLTITSLGLVFHFRSIDRRGDLFFRLEMFYSRGMIDTFLLNFRHLPQDWALSHLQPDTRINSKTITVVEGSETGEEFWRKIHWIEEGVKKGARVWLEKEMSEFQSVSFSRRLPEGATLGETFNLLKEMATTMMC